MKSLGLQLPLNVSHSPHSLKGLVQRIIYGTILGVIKGDTRNLDYSSYNNRFEAPGLGYTGIYILHGESIMGNCF